MVFTLRDKDAGGELGIAHTLKDTGAMVKLLQWCQWKSINLVHGIVKVEPWLITIRKNPQYITRERINSLVYIIRKAHVFPAILPLVQY